MGGCCGACRAPRAGPAGRPGVVNQTMPAHDAATRGAQRPSLTKRRRSREEDEGLVKGGSWSGVFASPREVVFLYSRLSPAVAVISKRRRSSDGGKGGPKVAMAVHNRREKVPKRSSAGSEVAAACWRKRAATYVGAPLFRASGAEKADQNSPVSAQVIIRHEIFTRCVLGTARVSWRRGLQ